MNYSPHEVTQESDDDLLLVAALPDSRTASPRGEAGLAAARRAGMNAVVEPRIDAPLAQQAFREACASLNLRIVTLADAAAFPSVTTPYAAYRAIADGAMALRFDGLLDADNQPTRFFYEARIAAQFLQTFRTIILRGKREQNLKSARGGLIAHETRTPQQGSIVWIENPDASQTITGSVFPFLPEVAVEPRTIFPYVHDAPIGSGASYLGSYAGLVKSDAPVLTAHILPDPHDGIRVYVYGEPGTTREVAVWSGNERGRGVDVSFRATTPQFYLVGLSQVVALPAALAGRTWLPANTMGSAPVLIGPDDVLALEELEATVTLPPARTYTLYALRPDGAITEISVDAPAPACALAFDFDDSGWQEIDDLAAGGNGANPGWYRAQFTLPDGDSGDAQIYFGAPSANIPMNRLTLWVNGERIDGANSVRLQDGANRVCLFADWRDAKGPGFGPVSVAPLGGCYLLDIARWRYAASAEAAVMTIAL